MNFKILLPKEPNAQVEVMECVTELNGETKIGQRGSNM